MSAQEESPAVPAADGAAEVLLYEKYGCNIYSEWTWQWVLRVVGEGKYRVVFRCETDNPPKPRPRTCTFREAGKLRAWIDEVWVQLNAEHLELDEMLEIGANLAVVDKGLGLEFNRAAIKALIESALDDWEQPLTSVDRVAIIMGGVKWLGSEPSGSHAPMRWGIIRAAIRQYIRNFLDEGQPVPTGEQQLDMTSGNPWEGCFASPVGGQQRVSGPVYIAPEAVEAAAKAARAAEGQVYRIAVSALGTGGKTMEGYPAVRVCRGLREAFEFYCEQRERLVDLLVDYITRDSVNRRRTKKSSQISLWVDSDKDPRGFELRWEADRSRSGTLRVGTMGETGIEFEEEEDWE